MQISLPVPGHGHHEQLKWSSLPPVHSTFTLVIWISSHPNPGNSAWKLLAYITSCGIFINMILWVTNIIMYETRVMAMITSYTSGEQFMLTTQYKLIAHVIIILIRIYCKQWADTIIISCMLFLFFKKCFPTVHLNYRTQEAFQLKSQS